MPNRTDPTTTQQNDPFNKYKAAKLNEDEAKRLRQMEIEAAAAASASVAGASGQRVVSVLTRDQQTKS